MAQLKSTRLLAGGTSMRSLGRLVGASRTPKPRGSTARRRMSEVNIFGDGEIMSVDYTLDNIKRTRENVQVTKLELEDVINREDGKEMVVFGAVKDLLEDDGGREWIYINFIDSIRVGFLGEDVSRLKKYEAERLTLWNMIKEHTEGKPVQFQVKLEILEDTPVSTIIEALAELQRMNVRQIEFMGALFGYKPPEIGNALAELCKPEDDNDDLTECGVLKEMVVLTVHMASDDIETANLTVRDRVWKKVLRRCVLRLKGQNASCSSRESGSDLAAMRAAVTSLRSTRSTGSLMPRRLSSDEEQKIMPNATWRSEGVRSLGRGSSHRSRRPRLATAAGSPGNSSEQVQDISTSRPGRVLRTVSSPMIKRGLIDNPPSKPAAGRAPTSRTGVKRTVSAKQTRHVETTDTKRGVNRTSSLKSKKRPEYDWVNHSDRSLDCSPNEFAKSA